MWFWYHFQTKLEKKNSEDIFNFLETAVGASLSFFQKSYPGLKVWKWGSVCLTPRDLHL